MKEILKVEELYKSYGDYKVLKGVNLNLYEGDIYGLIGPNGAGKITLIKVILGLIKKDKGKILFNNKELGKDDIKDNLSATIENPAFYEYMTGRENLDIYKRLLNLEDKDMDNVLSFVSMTDHADRNVGKYSLGMKQRLAIARAFINKPKIIILDEPTNGLDPNGVIELRKLINKMREEGVTIIFCSHQLSEVGNICNRFGFLSDGIIKEENDIKIDGDKIRNLEGFFTDDTDRN